MESEGEKISVADQLKNLFKTFSDGELARLILATNKYKKGDKIDEGTRFGDVCSILNYIPKGPDRNSAAIVIIHREAIERYVNKSLSEEC